MAKAGQTVSEPDLDATKAPLLEHLTELRMRLLWSGVAFAILFAISLFFAKYIFEFLGDPLYHAFERQCERSGQDLQACLNAKSFQYTHIFEAFFTHLKIAMFSALFVGFPFFAYQLWGFVAPGLYKKERMAMLPFLLAVPVLFFGAALLLYLIVFPTALDFALRFQNDSGNALGTALIPKMNEYLSISMTLLFAFGLAFQLPAFLTLLGRVGLLTSTFLRKNRKFAIVGAFAAAAILTPPDPFSQIGLALPIVLLYEVSIWSVRWVEPKPESEPKSEPEPDQG